MTEEWDAEEEEKPLNIKCTDTDCNNNLHCFKQNQRKKGVNLPFGPCRECGKSLVNWNRVQERCLNDSVFTFDNLKYELIRHHFWHKKIDQQAINHARRKGKQGMREAAENRIRQAVSPAEPSYDGRQTPKKGNAIYYAQHATACCCRKCIEYWHGIPLGQELNEEEIQYFTNLVMLYINERLPFLTENGEKVPHIVHKKRKILSQKSQDEE